MSQMNEKLSATPSNAAKLYAELKSTKAVGLVLGASKTRVNNLLHLAGVDLTPKTFEELHPRPADAQERYDACGSSRAFGYRYGMSQRQANKVLSFWKVRIQSSGREVPGVKSHKAHPQRIWCVDMKCSCVMSGIGNCAYCKTDPMRR